MHALKGYLMLLCHAIVFAGTWVKTDTNQILISFLLLIIVFQVGCFFSESFKLPVYISREVFFFFQPKNPLRFTLFKRFRVASCYKKTSHSFQRWQLSRFQSKRKKPLIFPVYKHKVIQTQQ